MAVRRCRSNALTRASSTSGPGPGPAPAPARGWHRPTLAEGQASALPSSTLATIDAKTSPGSRPFQGLTPAELKLCFANAVARTDGLTGAHCVHEFWMRGEISLNIERAL